MDIKFESGEIRFLRPVVWEDQRQEQTQEIRLTDDLPDAGRVLGCWGQCILRSKEWRSGAMAASGGVMTWTLYAPEDGGPAQCVEDWIPLSVKWPAEQSEGDGKLFTTWLLRGVDARTVDLRRLMVRVTVDVYAACFVPDRLPVYSPKELPKDILLLEKKKPLCLVQ